MTRKELARLARALMPYMSSANVCDAGRIARGLDMTGCPADVAEIVTMVAPAVRAAMPAGLAAIIAAAEEKSDAK